MKVFEMKINRSTRESGLKNKDMTDGLIEGRAMQINVWWVFFGLFVCSTHC